MHYPAVVGEVDTMTEVMKGKSIARFGDGEFKIARGGECVSQMRDRKLTQELSAILTGNNPHCIVGIPTMDPEGPKYHKWARYKDQYPKQLLPKRKYYSAFISRPDSAPWINTPEYFDMLEGLWRGQSVTLVGCGERSLKMDFLYQTGAYAVDFIKCPRRDAYSVIDVIERACMDSPNHRVLLCAGPTATCLADRLSRKGKHAVDLGHVGMFWRPYANEKSSVPVPE